MSSIENPDPLGSVDYQALFYGESGSEHWQKQVDIIKGVIEQERTGVPAGKATETEKMLCVGINQHVLRDSEHYVLEGERSEHFLATTKTRLAILREVGVAPEAVDISYDNFFRAFRSWRSRDLGNPAGVKRFFEETKQVEFPQEELNQRVYEHVGKSVVAFEGTNVDIQDIKNRKSTASDKDRLPSFTLSHEISEGMGMGEDEFNGRVFDHIVTACSPSTLNNADMRDELGLPLTTDSRKRDVDVVVRTGVKLDIPVQRVLNTMKEVWPTPKLEDVKT